MPTSEKQLRQILHSCKNTGNSTRAGYFPNSPDPSSWPPPFSIMPLHAGTAPDRNFSPRIPLHAGFSCIQKTPSKKPPKQPHRALLNSCVCSGHRCHIYFVTCPGYPNKTYPLLKLPHHPCPSHFRDICRFLPLLRLQKAVLPVKTISPSYSRGW